MQRAKANYEESFFSSSTILCDAATKALCPEPTNSSPSSAFISPGSKVEIMNVHFTSLEDQTFKGKANAITVYEVKDGKERERIKMDVNLSTALGGGFSLGKTRVGRRSDSSRTVSRRHSIESLTASRSIMCCGREKEKEIIKKKQ